jgi:hypothetical protein
VRQLLAFAIQLPSAKDREKDMKMKNLKLVMVASIGFSGIGLAGQPASATPMSGLDPAIATSLDTAKNVERIRWICGPWRCHWVPGWRRYGWDPDSYSYWRPPGYSYGYYHPWRHHDDWEEHDED